MSWTNCFHVDSLRNLCTTFWLDQFLSFILFCETDLEQVLAVFFFLFLNNSLEKMQLKHEHFWHFIYQKTVPGLKYFLNVFSYMFKGQCVLKSKMLSNPMWDYTCDFFWEEWWKRWTSASVYSKAEDISTWECLRRLNEDVKVSNGQRESRSA